MRARNGPLRGRLRSPAENLLAFSSAGSDTAGSIFGQENCWAVRLRWQFAHRTAHFLISAWMADQLYA